LHNNFFHINAFTTMTIMQHMSRIIIAIFLTFLFGVIALCILSRFTMFGSN
jgi:hypothetical protein